MKLQPKPAAPPVGSPFTGDITDALVRLAHRCLLPAQLRGARVAPAERYRIAASVCQSCVAVQVGGRRPLHLEWASVSTPPEMDPAQAVMLYAYDLDSGDMVGAETVLHLTEDELDPVLPYTQLVALLDSLAVADLQRQLAGWLDGSPGA